MSTGNGSRKQWWVKVLVAVVIVFAIGWWTGRAGPQTRVGELTAELAAVQARAETAEAENARALARIGLLQTQLQLMQAAIELDQRNFGIANRQVVAAREALAGVDIDVLGLDAEQVQALKAALADTDLTVATDLAAQRQVLVELIARVQALLPSD